MSAPVHREALAPCVDGLLTPKRQAGPRDGPSGSTCVQRLDGSRDSAIHTMYRISLRSSSMREPRYPLPGVISSYYLGLDGPRDAEASQPARQMCVPWRHPAPYSGTTPGTPQRAGTSVAGGAEEAAPPRQLKVTCAPVVFSKGDGNDPSAGSPTETLLRLLLPLNDKVQWTSRNVTGGEPPASPRSEHFTGPFNR